MEFPKPYEKCDETVVLLNGLIVKYFEIIKNRLIASNFDELNVMREVGAVYSQVLTVIKRHFRYLWCDDYIEWLVTVGAEERDKDFVNRIAGEAVTGLLDKPNPVTRYCFETEYVRAQQRLTEAIIATVGSVNKQLELDKAAKILSNMVKAYAILVSDDAFIHAMEDSNVAKVKWHAEHDKRTCGECVDRDERVYPLDKLPPKPHANCRCWLTPVLH